MTNKEERQQVSSSPLPRRQSGSCPGERRRPLDPDQRGSPEEKTEATVPALTLALQFSWSDEKEP